MASFNYSGTMLFRFCAPARTAALALLIAAGTLFSNTVYWICPPKGDALWSSDSNWSGGFVPGAGDAVVFDSTSGRPSPCVLDDDVSVGAIVFRPGFTAGFDFNGHFLTITGDTADFRTGGTVAGKNGRGGIEFVGPGQQSFFSCISRAIFPNVIINKQKNCTVICIGTGIQADSLSIISGTLSCGENLTHQVGNIRVSGGNLDLGTSRMAVWGPAIDLSGAQSLQCSLGTLGFSGTTAQKILLPADSQTFHALIQNGKSGTSIIKTAPQWIFADTMAIRAGALNLPDSATVYAASVVSSRGTLNLPPSGSLVVSRFADFSALDTLRMDGILECAGTRSPVTIIPKKDARIASFNVVKGKTAVAGYGLIADSIRIFQACTLSLGTHLMHSVSACSLDAGAVINFESSVLRFSGPRLDLSNAGSIGPGTGAIEFSGLSPQLFVPKTSETHPSIIQNGRGGTILSNHNLTAGSLTILSGTFHLNGFSATVDSLKGDPWAGTDTLSFDSSSLSYLRVQGPAAFNDLTLRGEIRLEAAGAGQDITFSGNSHVTKLVQNAGDGSDVFYAADSLLSVDTLVVRSGTLDIGKSTQGSLHVVCRSFSSIGGGVRFGGSTIVFTGDTLDLSQLSVAVQQEKRGGLTLAGKTPQVFVPKSGAVYPSLIQAGMGGTTVIKNGFTCNRLAFPEGAFRLGTSLTHTVLGSVDARGGTLDFGTATLNILSDSLDLSGLASLVPGNGTLSFNGARGTQWFMPKSLSQHPNLIKTQGATVALGGPCKAKKLWISGGTFDCNNYKCELTGFSAIGGSLAVGADSFVVYGNALFSGLSGCVTKTGPVVVRTAASCPVSIFSCPIQTIGTLVLSAIPSGGPTRIVATAGTHRVGHCIFEWNRSGDSAIFDFRKNNASLTVDDSADVAPMGSGIDMGYIYMGNGTWTIKGAFALANYARDGAKVVFSRDTGIQTIDAPLPLADVVHEGGGTLRLLSGLACRTFSQTSGALDFNGASVSADNDFLLKNGSETSIVPSDLCWKIQTGKNATLCGRIGRLLAITSARPCTVNTAGTLSVRYAVLKNCVAGRQKGVAYNSIDSLGNANWLFTNKPPAPSGLSAKRGNRAITLVWNKSPDGDALRYRINCGTIPAPLTRCDSTESAADTEATVTNLINGKNYFFRVMVADSAGYESDWSPDVRATPDSGLLDISAAKVGFGNVSLGASAGRVITLFNGCSDTVTISSVALSPSAFSSSIESFIIPPQGSVRDTLRFTPKKNGPDSATVVFSSNAGSSPDTVVVRGTGCAPVMLLYPDSVLFEQTEAYKAAFQLLRVKNTGNDTLRITALSRLGADDFMPDSIFTMSMRPVVAPGDSCLDTIRFLPKKPGVSSAVFIITSNCVTPHDTVVVVGICGLRPSTKAASAIVPKDYSLGEAVVFGRSVLFKYELPVVSRVTLEIYNAIGRFVERPLDGVMEAREHQLAWDGSHLSRGIYFCRFKAGDSENAEPKFVKTLRLIFSK
jgi:hypothetical protein